jgi:hypothetical protein
MSLKNKAPHHPRIQEFVLRILFTIIFSILLLVPSIDAIPNRQDRLRQTLRSFYARYNRVEGFFAGYQLKMEPPRWNGYSVFVQSGYGIQSEAFRWAVGLERIQKKYGFKFSVFDRTATHDNDMIRTAENSLFAILYKGDYRDYFRAKNGFSFHGTYTLKPRTYLWGSLSAYTYVSMPVVTHWSALRTNSRFRDNPAIIPGKIGIFELGIRYDTRRKVPRFLNSWHLFATYERGFREFAYNGLKMGLTRHQKVIWGNQAFIVQARLATRNHTAEQFLFDLGGVSTLRGYGIKEFSGNRMLWASIDYLFRGDIFSRIPIPASHLFNIVLFADTGWTQTAPRSNSILNGFQNANLTDFKTDIGIALGITERLFRLNIARRLDRSNDFLTVSARLFREF